MNKIRRIKQALGCAVARWKRKNMRKTICINMPLVSNLLAAYNTGVLKPIQHGNMILIPSMFVFVGGALIAPLHNRRTDVTYYLAFQILRSTEYGIAYVYAVSTKSAISDSEIELVPASAQYRALCSLLVSRYGKVTRGSRTGTCCAVLQSH